MAIMNVALSLSIALSALSFSNASPAIVERQATSARSSSALPDYFDTTSHGPYPGPTQTGQAPFLAQTDPVPGTAGLPSGTQPFVPNTPLQTSQAIPNNTNDIDIFQYMGNLGSYFSNPSGFGVAEFSLPSYCNITQVHLLHRHGSRYPTTGNSIQAWAGAWANATKAGANTIGALAYILRYFRSDGRYLTSWTYQLGAEILVPRGRQEYHFASRISLT